MSRSEKYGYFLEQTNGKNRFFPFFKRGVRAVLSGMKFARKRFHGWTLSQEPLLLVFVESNAPLQVPSDMKKRSLSAPSPCDGGGLGWGW
jgi:hypothetical protein